MPTIAIKYVVSFSSQDPKHPVSNLVRNDGYKKWLCDPRERSGRMEAILQLDQPCRIAYIDIGSIWCATLEFHVGSSEWSAGHEFEPLVHTVSLMTPTECSMGRNSMQTKMFSSDLFCPDVAKQRWDRIKIILLQPYKKMTQFGLSFIRVSCAGTLSSVTDTSRKTMPAAESIQDIKKHFLDKLNNSKIKPSGGLKGKLLKIAASSDVIPGSDDARKMNDDSLTRTAKLVLASSGQSPRIPPTHKGDKQGIGLHSNYVGNKSAPTLKEEVDKFLRSLQISACDLDNITLADLRHRLEKKKKRKLTKDEKRIFISMAKEHIATMFSKKSGETDNVQVNTQGKSTNNCGRTGVDRSADNCAQSMNVVNESKLENTPKSPLHFDSPRLADKNTKSVTPKVKRKLSNSDDLSASASKKILKEKFTSVRQQLKSPEVVVKRQIPDVCKVSGPSTNRAGSVNTPAAPFQYRGLRGIDADSADSQESNIENGKKDLLGAFSSGDKDWDFIKQSVDGVSVLESATSFPWLPDDGDVICTGVDSLDGEICGKANRRGGTRNRGRRRGGVSRGGVFAGPDLEGVCGGVVVGTRRRGKGRGRGKVQHVNNSVPESDPPGGQAGEITSRGFSKCPGCSNYFADSLLEAHQNRCAGHRSQMSSATATQEVTNGNQSAAQEVTSGIANKSAVRGRGRGRGRGKKTKSVSSLEIRPTGFVKCDGCNEYLNEDLLSLHHQHCAKWNSLPTSTETSPWMCSKPASARTHSVTNNLIGSPASASRTHSVTNNLIGSPVSASRTHSVTNNLIGSPVSASRTHSVTNNLIGSPASASMSTSCVDDGPIRSQPWLMAAERRLLQQNQGSEQISTNRNDSSSVSTAVLSTSSSVSTAVSSASSSATSSDMVESQRRMLEKYRTLGESAPVNAPSRLSPSRQTPAVNAPEQGFISSHLLPSQNVYASIDISDDDDEFEDVENVATPGVLGESAIQVECPLCGDFFPSYIIEMHAGSCYL